MTDCSRVQALYLHIPFCRSKCVYCDFDSRVVCSAQFERQAHVYVESVISRLQAFGKIGALEHIDTVYIGGGTPTLLGELLVKLVDTVMDWCRPQEFTCEANPESFSRELAGSLREHGVTRISLGVQSFDDRELKRLGRIHSAAVAEEAIRRAISLGFDVSADLMCGIPLQTDESWKASLSHLVSCGPDHVSVYPLTIEEGTVLDAMAQKDPALEPDEDFQASCMQFARDYLHDHGFDRYEVASYAKKGKRCRHNIAYWTGVSYLGIGRSASSMLARSEYESLSSFFPGVRVDDASARIRLTQLDNRGERFDLDALSAQEAAAEDLMLACRMTDGISERLLRTASDVIPEIDVSRACDRAVNMGLARWTHVGMGNNDRNRRLVPTDSGWLEGNVLFELLWDLAYASDKI